MGCYDPDLGFIFPNLGFFFIVLYNGRSVLERANFRKLYRDTHLPLRPVMHELLILTEISLFGSL